MYVISLLSYWRNKTHLLPCLLACLLTAKIKLTCLPTGSLTYFFLMAEAQHGKIQILLSADYKLPKF